MSDFIRASADPFLKEEMLQRDGGTPSDPESAFLAEEEALLLTATAEQAGQRLDVALGALLDVSRSAAGRLIESGAVTLSGRAASKKQMIKEGDLISVILPEPEECAAQPEDIPLDVVWEDDDLIVVNKPDGMVVHPAPGHQTGTLVSALLWHCKGSLSGVGGVLRPGIVHRIDRFTTGLIAAAKNDLAHEGLCAQLADHTMHRVYHALVIGALREEKGTVDAPIGRSLRDRKKMAVVSGGREARTYYEVVRGFKGYSLLQLRLETGRTHQIRVHMAHLGHPVLGDEVYGGDKCAFARAHGKLMSGQMLHAGELSLIHPRSGERMSFTAPLPENFRRALEILESEAQ